MTELEPDQVSMSVDLINHATVKRPPTCSTRATWFLIYLHTDWLAWETVPRALYGIYTLWIIYIGEEIKKTCFMRMFQWCQCCSLVYRIRRGAQTHLPSFCRLQKIQSEDRPPLHDLAQNVDSQTELRAGGLNESQVLVLADCGETKGSASSDKHTHSESTERSNASSLLIYIHTLNVEPQALAVNTQASHRMLCKYLQIGMHWREKDTADQAEHDWPQPTACTQHTPAHPQAWNELDKKKKKPKTWPYSASARYSLPWWCKVGPSVSGYRKAREIFA